MPHMSLGINRTIITTRDSEEVTVINIVDRASYQLFRQLWKEQYMAVAGTIRSVRTKLRTTARMGVNVAAYEHELRSLRRNATDMLAHLAEVKREGKAKMKRQRRHNINQRIRAA